jgi:hypothetical protein
LELVVLIELIKRRESQLFLRSSITFSKDIFKMKFTTTLSAFIAAIELAQATVYLAGDSTMAKAGANDGVTDGQ